MIYRSDNHQLSLFVVANHQINVKENTSELLFSLQKLLFNNWVDGNNKTMNKRMWNGKGLHM